MLASLEGSGFDRVKREMFINDIVQMEQQTKMRILPDCLHSRRVLQ